MIDKTRPTSIPPFPPGYRASGILLHVTSLPSSYGIGDLGPSAMAWVDQLNEAGQTWWQALPLGPTGYGDSPYQSLSSFAGNGLLISPDWIIEDGLLNANDCQGPSFSETAVDYQAVASFKHRLLEKAWNNFQSQAHADLQNACQNFRTDQAHWLEDYALFQALKARYNGAYYLQWPAELVRRDPAALERARQELAGQVDRVCFVQFLLFRQGARLREYARGKGVRLIGDLPFFVSPDSSDVWANPELFLLDEDRRPRVVAGVPPDYFSADGQLWGNPLYDWAALRRTGYRWCMDRIRALLAHVDVVRLDHFRAFVAAWQIPAGAPTARSGRWRRGPGLKFFNALEMEIGTLPFIAEDLGVITSAVNGLRDKMHLPGTRVLQFAFDGQSDNPYLPENYVPNTVVYTGTHDNPTTRGWYAELPENQRKNLWDYLKRPPGRSEEVARELIGLAWSSPAALAMTPLQDLLSLGDEARMNIPGRAEGNWRWRCTQKMLSDPAFPWIRDLTHSTKRSGVLERPTTDRVMEAASS
jgi:4-alpha-glucanotransferase